MVTEGGERKEARKKGDNINIHQKRKNRTAKQNKYIYQYIYMRSTKHENRGENKKKDESRKVLPKQSNETKGRYIGKIRTELTPRA